MARPSEKYRTPRHPPPPGPPGVRLPKPRPLFFFLFPPGRGPGFLAHPPFTRARTPPPKTAIEKSPPVDCQGGPFSGRCFTGTARKNQPVSALEGAQHGAKTAACLYPGFNSFLTPKLQPEYATAAGGASQRVGIRASGP